jgi:hypothetical protein
MVSCHWRTSSEHVVSGRGRLGRCSSSMQWLGGGSHGSRHGDGGVDLVSLSGVVIGLDDCVAARQEDTGDESRKMVSGVAGRFGVSKKVVRAPGDSEAEDGVCVPAVFMAPSTEGPPCLEQDWIYGASQASSDSVCGCPACGLETLDRCGRLQ